MLEACQAERTPLLERQKTYAAVRRENMMNATMASAKVGARMLLASGVLNALVPGSGLITKAIDMKRTASGAKSEPSNNQADVAEAVAAISIVVALSGTIDAYVKIKQQQYANDPRRISQSIEGDAKGQLSTSELTAKEMAALADCRTVQVADYKAKLAAVATDKERKDIQRGQNGLKAALKADIDLTEEVLTRQATMAKAFTVGRAMAEGKSEFEILESDKPALGGEPSMAVMKLPAVAVEPGAPQVPAEKASFVTARATAARAMPNNKSPVIMNFPAGRMVTPRGMAAGYPGWWEVEVAGSAAFLSGADLADPSAAPPPARAAKGKGRASAKAEPPPPNNVREFNHYLLTGKTQGVERLKVLIAEFQPPPASQSAEKG